MDTLNSDRTDVNFFFVQYIVNYNFGKGYAIGTAAINTCDWQISDGDKCTVPVGLQFSKVMNFGNQPVKLLIGYYENLVHPDGRAESQWRFQINFMFPTTKIH